MAMSMKPELRTGQSLVMTPQLMQAIKLLQMSSIDLTAFVDAELEQNPLLEREDTSVRDGDDDPGGGAIGHEAVGVDESEDSPLVNDPEPVGDLANDFDRAPPAPVPVPAESWAGPSRAPIGASDYNLEAFVADRRSLQDHLSEQLNVATCDPATRLIGGAIIGELDEAGYLRTNLDELGKRLGTSRNSIETTLQLLRKFEPTGVFARDLPECLALQLDEIDRLDPAMEALLANLHLVAKRDYAALRRSCGVDDDDLADMIGEVRSLNPKPGADFDPAPVHTIVPDVLVIPAHEGGWRVELNNETLPRVLVNQSYYATVSGASRKDEDRAFLVERFQTAKWLVDSLDRRARTILKVAIEIVRQQDAFLVDGVEHLRPLNLRAVADAIQMHESTVSRVTSNKYMATNRGLFELKYFFSPALQSTSGGAAHSAEAVRHRIRTIINSEGESILSDDAIVKQLRLAGIDIARRTVAKYREALGISSSVSRRHERRAAL